MKKLGAALLAILLAACGGGSDTSSNAGGDSSFGTSSADTGTSASPDSDGGTTDPSEATGSATASFGGPESPTSSDASDADGTYHGQLTATLSGEGVVPVTDSTDLIIEISGSDVTAHAEGRSYEGTLEGNSFSVEIPIDEESRGIICRGTPVLEGEVRDGTASGTVRGEGECFSETARVPVLVDGEFTASK